MPGNWSSTSPNKGLTLVEVVAGIALLTSLLVLTLTVFRVHAAQVQGAKIRMEAIRAADELLADWFSGAGVPGAGQHGPVPGHLGWIWRMMPNDSAGSLPFAGAMVLRLEIREQHRTAADGALTTVDLLVSAQQGDAP